MISVVASSALWLSAALMTTSEGATWAYVSEGNQGSLWYVDTGSLRDTPDDDGQPVRQVLIKTQYAAVKTGPAKEIKRVVLFKCSEELSKTLSYTEYNPLGEATRSYAYPLPAYDAVIPGTVLAGAMAKACTTQPK
ncbi:MAG: hypothetical protein B7Y43_13160 [Sphingomonas sp. 28-62-20]|uniref:surface-adhesin E family protein n=1 Tax=unclassified Sphingomonas TaxID=196159 RepID=UPI000BD652D6|nr:hypothetical protein [Sphingomonas sp.]OYY76851.1 MAG: hypothetical protein B7Y43_13160 [Sphingomonas sp. 28-62-20]